MRFGSCATWAVLGLAIVTCAFAEGAATRGQEWCVPRESPRVISLSSHSGRAGDKIEIEIANPPKDALSVKVTCSWLDQADLKFFADEKVGSLSEDGKVTCVVPFDTTLSRKAVVVVGILPKRSRPQLTGPKSLNSCYSHFAIKNLVGCHYRDYSDWKECAFVESRVDDEALRASFVYSDDTQKRSKSPWCPAPFSKRQRCPETCPPPRCKGKNYCAKRIGSCCSYRCVSRVKAKTKAKQMRKARQKQRERHDKPK